MSNSRTIGLIPFSAAPGCCQTGYARLSAGQARAVLALWLLAALLCVGVTLSPLARGYAGVVRPGPGDVELYRAEVERMQAGEGYYQAAAAELHERGYPTRSIFNWRTPLPMWLIGHVPRPVWGKVLLGLLALMLLRTAFEALMRDEPAALARHAACIVLLSCPLVCCVLDDLFVMPVLWAGVLMALSLVCYGSDRSAWGVGFGVAALFMRELALPYCLLAMGMAWWNGRRRELLLWAVGLAAWTLFFEVHALRVLALIQPGDRAHTQGWLQLGGAAFVLSTVQLNAYLLLCPQWVAALWFVAAMCGFAGWNTPLGRRVGGTACLYVVAFGLVGQQFNQYWGALVAPLWCFGVARLPASLRDLCRAVGGSKVKHGVPDLSTIHYPRVHSRY
jgi:hypothetical protein